MRHLYKIIFLFIVSLFIQKTIIAQDSTQNNWQISLLTCGTGEELYSSFGHSGIRVINKATREDVVYNYGTFDFSQPGFYKKFTLGKLLYYLDKNDYNDFLQTYIREKRSVKEQVLDLNDSAAEKLYNFLEYNLEPNQRYYKYDFIYDNCATRIRDAVTFTYGNSFQYGPTLYNKKASYRQAINQYIIGNHWSRFGINLLLGAKVDSNMTDNSAMFLPDFLFEGFKNASFEGHKAVKSTTTIFEGSPNQVHTFNGPFWMMMGILILVILAYHVPIFHYIRPAMNFLLLFTSGLLGVFMLFMWFGTDHQATKDNFNIIWALPTNLIIAFLLRKPKAWFKIYGLAGISTIIVSLVIHAIGIQEMPMIELIPFLGALMYVYMNIYKKGVTVSAENIANA